MADPDDFGDMLLPPYPMHPGPWLLEEVEVRGLTLEWLSERTGRPLQEILDVVEERTLIDEDFAQDLERALGTDARTWVNASKLYLLTVERDEREAALARAD